MIFFSNRDRPSIIFPSYPPFFLECTGLTAVFQSSALIILIKMGSRASIQLQEAELNEIQSETGCE